MYSLAEEVSVTTVAATATTTGHHMLKIEGYSRLKKMYGNGSALLLPEFEAAGHTWKIHFYPNGEREEDAGFVSVYHQLTDADRDAHVLVEYDLALVHHQHDGTAVPPPSQYKVHRIVHGFHHFKKRYKWGYPKFISHKRLEGSDFLKDDSLAVHYKISTIEEQVLMDKVVQAQDLERMGIACTGACDYHSEIQPVLSLLFLEPATGSEGLQSDLNVCNQLPRPTDME
ncbi:hypothetical protein QOZ80_7BG0586060 [Eleusine coracana subsp. coracana]|nr:hypothetical protein QOZ80_7BG0586060 [Eleusine coracana subsp. coracana]